MARHSGLVLRLRVPNTGSVVELSSKFGALAGEAVDLIAFAHNNRLEVEGLSFHVGSQCTNPHNYNQALHLAARIFAEAGARGFDLKLPDIGGGFPHYGPISPADRNHSRSQGVSWLPLPPPPSRRSSTARPFAATSFVTASTTGVFYITHTAA